MGKLFAAGYDRIRDPDPKVQWEKEPPEQMPYDEFVIRQGIQLTTAPRITLASKNPSDVPRPPLSPSGRPFGSRMGKAPAYLR